MTQTAPPVSGAHRSGTVAPAPAAEGAEARMAWLDVARALGALIVVYAHLGTYLDLGLPYVSRWLDAGRFGVLLFFLVSGYVIPMSLERHGSLRRFWVGRLFRIYPAWLLSVAATAVLIALGLAPLYPALGEHPAAAVLGHLVMSQELIGLPGLMSVFWTLSFEMLFYLLVSALFVLGLHRRVAAVAGGLAVVALFGVRTLPAESLTGSADGKLIAAVVTFVVFGGSIAAYLSGRRVPAVIAAVAGLGCLVLPVVNGGAGSIPHTVGSWQALFYLAVMFSGTVVHAAHRGRIHPWAAAVLLSAVFLAGVTAGLRHAGTGRDDIRWIGTLAGVAAVFALGYALRRWPLPGWAAWLGRISYSIYLLHFVVLFPFVVKVAPYLDRAGAVQQAFLFVGYMTVVLVASHLSYVHVERPGQELGRRVGRALDRRWPVAGDGRDRPGPRNPHQRRPGSRAG